MKYTLRHALAVMVLFAVAIQAGRAYSIRQHLQWLELAHEYALQSLHRGEEKGEPDRKRQQLCRQVVFDYEYPADYEAAARRFARLNPGKPPGK